MTTIRDMSQWIELEKQKQIGELQTVAFASAAHEFRNPLNSIIQSMELLSNFIENERAYQYFCVAKNSCNLMLFLVNDILDYAQFQQQKIILNMDQVVSLSGLINECIEILKQKAVMKKIELLAEIDPFFPELIAIDGNRVKQVLINLISNSIKYTKKGHVKVLAKVVND